MTKKVQKHDLRFAMIPSSGKKKILSLNLKVLPNSFKIVWYNMIKRQFKFSKKACCSHCYFDPVGHKDTHQGRVEWHLSRLWREDYHAFQRGLEALIFKWYTLYVVGEEVWWRLASSFFLFCCCWCLDLQPTCFKTLWTTQLWNRKKWMKYAAQIQSSI